MSAEVHGAGVRGAFYTLEEAGDAINALEADGFAPDDITVFSPIPTPHLEDHITRPTSKVRLMTLVGGVLGTITGFVLTYWTFFDWKMRVGGKPIASFPVTIIIMFELTVLLGGLFTLAGVFIFSRIPALRGKPGYHRRFSDDLFGIYVHVADGGAQQKALGLLNRLGSVEVDDVA